MTGCISYSVNMHLLNLSVVQIIYVWSDLMTCVCVCAIQVRLQGDAVQLHLLPGASGATPGVLPLPGGSASELDACAHTMLCSSDKYLSPPFNTAENTVFRCAHTHT